MTPPLPRLPPHAPGMRIGLFGGSFDPPHEGHALVSRLALTRLKLDRLWWVVSPGNPLKDASELPSIEGRIAAAKKILRDPRVAFTGFEAEIGARYTCDTLEFLHAHCPGVRFVWIMGADNLLAVSSLATMAGDCADDAHRRHRPAGRDAQSRQRQGGGLFQEREDSRERGRYARRDAPAGDRLPARAETRAFVDRTARRDAFMNALRFLD